MSLNEVKQGQARNLSILYPKTIQKSLGAETLNKALNQKMGSWMFSQSTQLSQGLVFLRQQQQANLIKKTTDTATALAVKGATDAFQEQLTRKQLEYQQEMTNVTQDLMKEAVKVPYLEKNLADTQSKYLELVNAPPVEKENWDLFGGLGDALKGAVPYLIIGGVALLGIFMFTRRK